MSGSMPPTMAGSGSRPSVPKPIITPESTSDLPTVRCRCPNKPPAIRDTCRESGRQFYSCKQSKYKFGCRFFQWIVESSAINSKVTKGPPSPTESISQCDASLPLPPAPTTTAPAITSNSSMPPVSMSSTMPKATTASGSTTVVLKSSTNPESTSELAEVRCKCPDNPPAMCRTVRKSGPNFGRDFYSCSRYPNNSCRFFQWINETSVTNSDSNKGPPSPNEFTSQSKASITAQLSTLKALESDAEMLRNTPDNGARLRLKIGLLQEALRYKKAFPDPELPIVEAKSVSRSTDFSQLSHDTFNLDKNMFRKQVTKSHLATLAESLSRKHNVKSVAVNDNLTATLYPHQQLGFSWMYARERRATPDHPRGGIIADDMGLGKTLQMIALILSSHTSNMFEMSDPSLVESKSTLIICPLAVVNQWDKEIRLHSRPNALHVHIQHGNRRLDSPTDLAKFDVVITTYQTIVSSLKSSGALHGINWHRIVLDEAHFIKNSKTATAKAVYALESRSRWYMSATPLQNDIKDLYSAFRFLRYSPFDDIGFWNSLFSYSSKSNLDPVKRLHPVLQSIMIRRTMGDRDDDGNPLVTLPPRDDTIQSLEFNESDRRVYERLKNLCKEKVVKIGGRMDDEKKSGAFLTALLHMRRFCNGIVAPISEETKGKPSLKAEPDELAGLLEKMSIISGTEPASSGMKESADHDANPVLVSICSMCSDLVTDVVVSGACGCIFCRECILPTLDSKTPCPVCNKHLPADGLVSTNVVVADQLAATSPESLLPRFYKSPKMAWLLQHLDKLHKEQPDDKVVIFSQWTSMLDLVAQCLDMKRIQYARMDGAMTRDRRDKELDKFHTDSETSIFLLSLKCAGVGLNLTIANHCIMLDTWWNKAIEDQAYARIYRIGQMKPVYIHRLIMKDSIEEGILKLQERKIDLAARLLKGADLATLPVKNGNSRGPPSITSSDLQRLLFL